MLPALQEVPPNYQRYTITTQWGIVEGEKVLQYGIEQISLDGKGSTTKIHCGGISNDKAAALELMKRLEYEDVDSEVFMEIVEDYVNEISMID